MADISDNFPKDKQLRSKLVNKIRSSCDLVKDVTDGSSYDSCKMEGDVKYITVYITSTNIGMEAYFAIENK